MPTGDHVPVDLLQDEAQVLGVGSVRAANEPQLQGLTGFLQEVHELWISSRLIEVSIIAAR